MSETSADCASPGAWSGQRRANRPPLSRATTGGGEDGEEGEGERRRAGGRDLLGAAPEREAA